MPAAVPRAPPAAACTAVRRALQGRAGPARPGPHRPSPPTLLPTPPDYHYLRNYIHVARHWGAERAQRHVPPFARAILAEVRCAGQGLLRALRCWAARQLRPRPRPCTPLTTRHLPTPPPTHSTVRQGRGGERARGAQGAPARRLRPKARGRALSPPRCCAGPAPTCWLLPTCFPHPLPAVLCTLSASLLCLNLLLS